MDDAPCPADDANGMSRDERTRRFDDVWSDDEEERFRAFDYEVDADAVAAAIVARLLAGRLPDVWRST
jgi:hypothetical protein